MQKAKNIQALQQITALSATEKSKLKGGGTKDATILGIDGTSTLDPVKAAMSTNFYVSVSLTGIGNVSAIPCEDKRPS